MQLVRYPDPRLIQVCTEAPIQDQKDRAEVAAGMWKIMRDNKGVGLAANQAGLDIRMFVWVENGHPQAIWNPTLSCISGSAFEAEGCLSLPKINVKVQRHTSSILSGQGMNGLPLRYFGNEILTRIWQHEIDHLDGKLIIDHMDRNETIANKKQLKKLLKNAVS